MENPEGPDNYSIDADSDSSDSDSRFDTAKPASGAKGATDKRKAAQARAERAAKELEDARKEAAEAEAEEKKQREKEARRDMAFLEIEDPRADAARLRSRADPPSRRRFLPLWLLLVTLLSIAALVAALLPTAEPAPGATSADAGQVAGNGDLAGGGMEARQLLVDILALNASLGKLVRGQAVQDEAIAELASAQSNDENLAAIEASVAANSDAVAGLAANATQQRALLQGVGDALGGLCSSSDVSLLRDALSSVNGSVASKGDLEPLLDGVASLDGKMNDLLSLANCTDGQREEPAGSSQLAALNASINSLRDDFSDVQLLLLGMAAQLSALNTTLSKETAAVDAALRPVVNSVDPNPIGIYGKETLTLMGSNFQFDPVTVDMTVANGSTYGCAITHRTAAVIECHMPRMAAAALQPSFMTAVAVRNEFGLSSSDMSVRPPTVTGILGPTDVCSQQPTHRSGGRITITGSYFPPYTDASTEGTLRVLFLNASEAGGVYYPQAVLPECLVREHSATAIVCDYPKLEVGTGSGDLFVSVHVFFEGLGGPSVPLDTGRQKFLEKDYAFFGNQNTGASPEPPFPCGTAGHACCGSCPCTRPSSRPVPYPGGFKFLISNSKTSGSGYSLGLGVSGDYRITVNKERTSASAAGQTVSITQGSVLEIVRLDGDTVVFRKDGVQFATTATTGKTPGTGALDVSYMTNTNYETQPGIQYVYEFLPSSYVS